LSNRRGSSLWYVFNMRLRSNEMKDCLTATTNLSPLGPNTNLSAVSHAQITTAKTETTNDRF